MVRRLLPKGRRQVICSLWNVSLSVGASMKLQYVKEKQLSGSWLTASGEP